MATQLLTILASGVHIRNPVRQVGAAFFDYIAKEHDELSLERGSVVEIIQNDWYI